MTRRPVKDFASLKEKEQLAILTIHYMTIGSAKRTIDLVARDKESIIDYVINLPNNLNEYQKREIDSLLASRDAMIYRLRDPRTRSLMSQIQKRIMSEYKDRIVDREGMTRHQMTRSLARIVDFEVYIDTAESVIQNLRRQHPNTSAEVSMEHGNNSEERVSITSTAPPSYEEVMNNPNNSEAKVATTPIAPPSYEEAVNNPNTSEKDFASLTEKEQLAILTIHYMKSGNIKRTIDFLVRDQNFILEDTINSQNNLNEYQIREMNMRLDNRDAMIDRLSDPRTRSLIVKIQKRIMSEYEDRSLYSEGITRQEMKRALARIVDFEVYVDTAESVVQNLRRQYPDTSAEVSMEHGNNSEARVATTPIAPPLSERNDLPPSYKETVKNPNNFSLNNLSNLQIKTGGRGISTQTKRPKSKGNDSIRLV